MAGQKQKLFTEVATVDFPRKPPPGTKWTFRSRLTGEPNSGFPSGTHQNEGELVDGTENGNNIHATYKGTLTIGNQSYDWTSTETSKVTQDGNIEGTEVVTFTTQIPGVQKRIDMGTKWEKDSKKVTNTGYK
jgi:hypothetical protein